MKIKIKPNDLLCINECIVTDDNDTEINIFRESELIISLIKLAKKTGSFEDNIGYIPDDIGQEFLAVFVERKLNELGLMNPNFPRWQ